MDQSTDLLLKAIDGLPDADVIGPSALPGWTRGHVLAHVHFNALALRNLVHWAKTGEPTPMYASAEQREADIAAGAALRAAELRRLVHRSAAELADDLDGVENWGAEVTTAQGRTVTVEEVPWMRTREVAMHAVDLDCGVTFSDLSAGLIEALTGDVVAKRLSRGEGPVLLAWLSGREESVPALGSWL